MYAHLCQQCVNGRSCTFLPSGSFLSHWIDPIIYFQLRKFLSNDQSQSLLHIAQSFPAKALCVGRSWALRHLSLKANRSLTWWVTHHHGWGQSGQHLSVSLGWGTTHPGLPHFFPKLLQYSGFSHLSISPPRYILTYLTVELLWSFGWYKRNLETVAFYKPFICSRRPRKRSLLTAN